jgi:hypothetical protein
LTSRGTGLARRHAAARGETRLGSDIGAARARPTPYCERLGVGVLIPVRKPAGGQELDINTRTSLKRRHIRNIKLERFPPQVTGRHSMPLGSCAFLGQLETQFPAHRPTPSSAYQQNAPRTYQMQWIYRGPVKLSV